jgi:hypothetical protein
MTRTRLAPPLTGAMAHTMTWCWQWPSSAGMSSDHSQTGGALIADWRVPRARKLVFDAFHLLLDSLCHSLFHGQGSAQCFAQQHRQSSGVGCRCSIRFRLLLVVLLTLAASSASDASNAHE